jgi:hypothetical protein
MGASVAIRKIDDFDSAFRELGAKVGPRTGRNKRTQDEKDWYVLRCYLQQAIAAKKFSLPLVVTRGSPPAPDFSLEHKRGSAVIEITEATNNADQREMTLGELRGVPYLLGELGGRFEGGGGEPGHLWASDILEAVERKRSKSIFLLRNTDRHLVIYPNSNASSLISDDEGERRAFSILLDRIDAKRQELKKLANGCFVHVLGKSHIFFNVLGPPLVRRRN